MGAAVELFLGQLELWLGEGGQGDGSKLGGTEGLCYRTPTSGVNAKGVDLTAPPGRLLRIPLSGDLAPERAPLVVAGEPGAFALCGAWAGGGALAGCRPVRVGGHDDDPFALLDERIDVDGADVDAVGGGWVGYLGYDLGRRLERLPPGPPRPAPLPAFALAFYDHVVRCDAAGRWWFEALSTPGRAAALREALVRTAGPAGRAAGARPRSGRAAGARAVGPAAHLAAVEACRERIAAGDLFQANLCLRLQGDWEGDPAALAAAAWDAFGPTAAPSCRGPGARW